MNPENTLEILINLRAKVDEALTAQKALDDVKGATKSGAAADTDAADATEKLNIKKRELHRLIHGLPPEYSQAGYAFTSLFFNPIYAAMLALTAVYQVAKKQLDDWNKALDAEGVAAAASATGALENHRKVLDDIGTSMARYRTELAKAGVEADPLSEKIKNQNELYNLQIEAVKKLLIASGHKDQAEALGGVKGAHDVAALNKELYDRGMQIADLNNQVEAAKKEKETADTAQANAKSELEKLRTETGAGGDLQKKVEAAALKAQNLAAQKPETFYTPEGIPIGTNADTLKKQQDAAQADAAAARATLTREQDRIRQLESADQSRKDAAAAADQALSAAQSEATRNQARIRQLPGEIGKEEGKQAVDVSQRGVSDATGLADKLLGGGKIEAGQQQFLMRIANLATGHANNLQQAATAVHALEGNNTALMSLLEKLTRLSESNRDRLITLEQAARSAH
jgi:hypothetical protein